MISLVIPTYNRRMMLDYTLNSVLKQSIDLNKIEVIVVDDGSSDDTRALVDLYKSLMNVRYFFKDDNGYGVASARNIGIRQAKHNLIIMIDSGVILHPEAVASHLRLHLQQPSPVAVVGLVYGFSTVDEDALDIPPSLLKPPELNLLFDWLQQRADVRDIREKEYERYKYRIDHLPAPWAYFWTNHVSVNKACLGEEEFFDLAYEPHYGYEDIDLGYRLFRKRIPIVLGVEAKSFHSPHKKVDAYQESLERNAAVFHTKFNNRITKAFVENGTWGFNEQLLAMPPAEIDAMYGK